MAGDINRVTLVGRLTRDPELRHLPSGTPVLEMGLAVNGRQQDDAGNWVDKPNFFDVKVYGNQAEMLSQHLARGAASASTAASTGAREAQDGTKRSKVDVVAQSVQFLDSRQDGGRLHTSLPAPPRAGTTSRPRRPTTTFPSRSDHGIEEAATEKAYRSDHRTRQAKSCHFCRDKVAEIDYKNIAQLGGTSPRRGRFARAGSPALAGATRSRWRRRSSGRGRWLSSRTSARSRTLMQIILLTDVEKLGLRGDVVDVARGYARNYLLPRRMAETATPARVAELRRSTPSAGTRLGMPSKPRRSPRSSERQCFASR